MREGIKRKEGKKMRIKRGKEDGKSRGREEILHVDVLRKIHEFLGRKLIY